MMLFTIGYEGATLPEVIGRLRAAGVEVVVDVRAVAASRRAGFSKTVLRESLAAEGIGYEHVRALGTPKPGRDAAARRASWRGGDLAGAHARRSAGWLARDGDRRRRGRCASGLRGGCQAGSWRRCSGGTAAGAGPCERLAAANGAGRQGLEQRAVLPGQGVRWRRALRGGRRCA
jgi:hypothetical protein